MHTGPNIERDGLVFGYDTGQFASTNPNFETFRPVNGINRFFKGRDSVNYIAFQNPRIDSSYSSYTRGTGTWDSRHPDAITVYSKNGSNLSSMVNTGVGDWSNTDHAHWQLDPILKKPVVVMHDITGSWKAKSFGTAMPSWSSLGLTHGSKYTISWLQWTDNLAKNAKAGLYSRTTAVVNGFHDGQANSPTSYNTKLRTWQRVYQTYTTSAVRDLNSTYLSIYMYGHYNVRATVKIADVQLEIYDHATTYQEFDGSSTYTQTRSSTQSLIDLTKTTNIDVSNVSFDSDGLPTFDGTDDKIVINNMPHIWDGDVTFESVVAWDDDTRSILLGNYNVGANDVNFEKLTSRKLRFYWNRGERDIFTSSNAVTTDGTYNHVVMIRDTSTNNFKFYVNGELISTSTSNAGTNISSTGSTFRVGGDTRDGTTIHNGQIPVVKLYNRALSAQEVQQNFKAYKNRFNL
jgi:hypothetical protein